jgi:putative transposase
MSRSKHTEAQMIAAVKQMEAGRKAEDVAREVGVSTHTIYAWKSKYGGMDVSEAQEAKRLRDENARLKKLVADLSFNSKLREECLRVSWFQNLFEARRIIANWRSDYNERRPHSSLSYMTPAEFAAQASGGKDAGFACLKNDTAVFHFPTATAAAG